MEACSEFVSKTEVVIAADLVDASATDSQTLARDGSGLSPAKMKLFCSIERHPFLAGVVLP